MLGEKGVAISVRGRLREGWLPQLRSCAAVLVLLIVALSASSSAWAEKRVALVMGLSAYRSLHELKNPKNDAADVSEALKQQGFDVLFGEDLEMTAMRDLIARFTARARDADVSLFYYAGHGFQVDSQNYLVPVDAVVRDAASVKQSTISLQTVLSGLEGGRGLHLVFLDACRNNPLPPDSAGGAILRDGLARVGNAANFLIAYATQPDNVAYDGAGRNSPFATALLSHIATRGQDIASMMIKVRRDVIAATGGQQIPFDASSLTRQFAFRPGTPETASPEVQLWQLGVGLRDPALLKLYIERFPTGAHIAEARNFLDPTKLASLEGGGVSRSSDAAGDTAMWNLTSTLRLRPLAEFYLDRFPSGQHADDARKLLDTLPNLDSADIPPETLCERLATHPRDATANLDGVPLDTLIANADRAIGACRQAMTDHPEMPNYAALLARALWAANQRAEALQLYRKAADRGNLRAMVSLGLILEAGDGVPKDVRGAYALYERAAAGGSPDGAINLAVALMQGNPLPRNVPRAIELLTTASRQGSAIATFNLGVLAEQKTSGTPEQALGYFRKAVELGDVRGYRAAAVLLDEGRGTRKDPDAAAESLLRAVAADSGDALNELTKATKNWSPETIRALQQRLQREGYYQGAPDGRTGPKLRQPLLRWRHVGNLFPNAG